MKLLLCSYIRFQNFYVFDFCTLTATKFSFIFAKQCIKIWLLLSFLMHLPKELFIVEAIFCFLKTLRFYKQSKPNFCIHYLTCLHGKKKDDRTSETFIQNNNVSDSIIEYQNIYFQETLSNKQSYKHPLNPYLNSVTQHTNPNTGLLDTSFSFFPYIYN